MNREPCFARESYVEILQKRISGFLEGYRQNLAFIGDELVGKTLIIHKFLHSFYNNRVIPVYLEVRHESLSSFVQRFSAVLLYNFMSESGIPLQEDLTFLTAKSEKYIPKTVARIRAIVAAAAKRKKSNVFTELLSLCELIHEETGKHCVVIFDEFHNLEEIGFGSLYREWSKLLISQKSTMYIITSSMQYRAKAILSKNLSLLFGNFEVVTVEPFDIRTSERYLVQRMEGSVLDAAARNFIVHFTGGFPLYLEVIAGSLLKQGQANLVDILEHMLFDSCGLLNQRFSNYIKRFQGLPHSSDYISILYLVASGRNKIKDICHLVKKQKHEIDVRINKLLELDTVTRTGDFLKINDRVLGFWIRLVYQEKLRSLTFDARNQKMKFRDSIQAMINDFYAQAKKPLAERVTEVLRLFENETIQLERKKVKLSHFREIKPLEFNNRSITQGLIGRSQDSLWILGFKHDLLTEHDITEFSRECKKYRHKLQRKIIITLNDIDANTRLRAMEEKIWTWDVSRLNQFLDLFSKPWVVT